MTNGYSIISINLSSNQWSVFSNQWEISLDTDY
jgi:hypothetical protein